MKAESEAALMVCDQIKELTIAVRALTVQVNSIHETLRQTLEFKGENTFAVRTERAVPR